MLGPIVSLDEEEKVWWESTIKRFRKEIVAPPRDYVDRVLLERGYSKELLQEDVETLLIDERQNVYEQFLIAEAELNAKVVSHLIENRPMPKAIFDDLIQSELLANGLAGLDAAELRESLIKIIGQYTGKIFPYLYALSLSSTNSRRSRAGTTFEALIEAALKIFDFPFQNQSSLGKNFFEINRIGKKVDLIIPGSKAYETRRSNCAIVSVKTSLRERWQEVVEELVRSNVPHIFLATLDDSITKNQLEIMKQYNITLVVRQAEKDAKFSTAGTVESFSTFYNVTVPHIVGAWPEYSNEK